MDFISCKQARDNLAEVVSQVAYGHKRYGLTRHGQRMVVLISFEEWKEIEQLMQKKEDEEDIKDADKAHARYLKNGGVSLEKIKKNLDR
jgi:prevent-host-death family protein